MSIDKGKVIIDRKFNFLASNPDGFIDNDKLVIVKSPQGCEKNSLEYLAKTDPDFCLQIAENMLQLSPTHDYYYQIQGDLHICEKKVCYFVVSTPTEFYYQRVPREDQVWKEVLLDKITPFYRYFLFVQIFFMMCSQELYDWG